MTAVEGFRTLTFAERGWALLDRIDADPDAWDQRSWQVRAGCHTAACAAGTLCAMAGDKPDFGPPLISRMREISGFVWVGDRTGSVLEFVPDRAAHLLGFDSREAMDDSAAAKGNDLDLCWDLFDESNTRADLERIITALFGPRP